jgi:osmotically inducible protein OsmC
VPRLVRDAEIAWEGTVSRGGGAVRAVSSGAFELPITLASRIANEDKTNPEELLAAAHASCFAMSLGGELHGAGTPAERVTVRCTITMDEVEGKGHQIVSSELSARVLAPDVDEDALAKAAAAADEGCPFSTLVRGTATVTYDATLEGGS